MVLHVPTDFMRSGNPASMKSRILFKLMLKTLLGSVVLAATTLVPASALAATATATIYDKWYDGRPTASGKTFRYMGKSAAHPDLPFGTYKVTYMDKSVLVDLNDRLYLRRLDLSCGAAEALFGTCKDFKVSVQYERVK